MRRLVPLLAVGALAGVAGAQPPAPSTLRLPNGFQPEGISISGTSFYVGSIPTGAVYRGSLATGRGSVLVRAASGRAAIGLEVDRGRVFVAGGDTGRAFVYDARTGRQLAAYALVSNGFVNDVVVTRSAAWFTDSQNPFLYRLPLGRGGRPPSATGFQRVRLRGAIRYVSGFNVNGIDATPDGATLVIVQSNTGRLFTVNPANGVARSIALSGGSVANGDGILLSGRRLYVVRNQDNQIAVVRLAVGLRRGAIVRTIRDRRFDVPTTIDESGSYLYAVNARFGISPTRTTRYQVVRVPKR
jgi:sugar lactone lactonase YvrE